MGWMLGRGRCLGERETGWVLEFPLGSGRRKVGSGLEGRSRRDMDYAWGSLGEITDRGSGKRLKMKLEDCPTRLRHARQFVFQRPPAQPPRHGRFSSQGTPSSKRSRRFLGPPEHTCLRTLKTIY